MPKKKLTTSDVDSSFCLTKRELIGWLASQGFDDRTPVLLKCNGKNYRLKKFKITGGKPILIGQRSARD